MSDQNLSDSDYLSFLLPTGERIVDQKLYSFDTSQLEEGEYVIGVFVEDQAKNTISSKIMFEIDHSIIDSPKPSIPLQDTSNDTNYLLIIIFGMIVIAIVSVLVILKQKSKIPQKN